MPKKEKKLKLPIKRIISNNIFMLKLIHKSAPFFVVLNLVLSFFEALAGFVSGSLLLRYALNGISEGKSFVQITTVLLLGLALQLAVSGASAYFYNRYSEVKMTDIHRDMRKMVYEKAASVELGCYENPEFYDDMVKAVDECVNRANQVIWALDNIIYMITNFSTNFILIILIDPVLLFFVLIPLISIPLKSLLNKVNYKYSMETRETTRRMGYSARTFYLADYAKEMRMSNIYLLMFKRFEHYNKKLISIVKNFSFRKITLNYLITECNELFTALGATFYSVWQCLGVGRMGYGDCIVVVNSIDSISYTLTYSAEAILRFQDNALYIENLRKFLDYDPKIKDGKKPLSETGDIVLENVSFKYDSSDKYTLKNLSMTFGKNEKIAIVGHNGAGKSTLVKLLLRLYDCEGTITYGGVDIKDFKTDEYRNMFSAVMQDFHIFALSVLENVLLRKENENDKDLVINALKQSGIYDKVASYEKGIDTLLTREFDKNGQQLSGGEQQKLAISHIYSKPNRFVILDEPSSALDPIAEYEMYNNMMSACKDCGVIFISHRLSSAVMADRIYLMEDGKVIETGTHTELMSLDGRYADMFRKQAQNYAEVENVKG